MEGNNSKRTKKILGDPSMLKLWVDGITAKDEDKKYYKFTQDAEGYLHISYDGPTKKNEPQYVT